MFAELHDSPRRLRVFRALASLVPAPRRGHRLLTDALAASGDPAWPAVEADILTFVRGPVRATLESEFGELLARPIAAEMERAVERELADEREPHDTIPATPSSRRLPATDEDLAAVRVALAHRDPVRADLLVRGLRRSRLDVSLGFDTDPEVVIVSEADALDLSPALRQLLFVRPNTAVVACDCAEPAAVEASLRACGVRFARALPLGAPASEVAAVALLVRAAAA